ncbi:MAG: DoxX family protein [Deltaproteobacteria bacterium]|nr:DoxX family protein [Deltaproteobacteria bacterium]
MNSSSPALPPAVEKLRSLFLDVVAKLEFIAPTLTRVALGVLFIKTGWGKLNNLDGVTEFFTSLGIPMPHLNAIMAAATEFGCGALLVAGLFTRLAAIPLSVTMVVATLTAKRADIEGWNSFFGLAEVTYILLFIWLIVRGAGPLSLDAVLARKFPRKG